MCGIVGIIGRNGITKEHYDAFLSAWERAQDRGRDACGYIAATGKAVHWWKWNQPSPVGVTYLRRDMPWRPGMTFILGHTRFATSGSPEQNYNNHPLVVGPSKDLFGIHNGVITNKEEVLGKHGIKATREVDTEAAFRLIHKYGVESTKPLEQLRGLFNLAYCTRKDTKRFYLVRKGNPLTFKTGRDYLAFGSLGHYWTGLPGDQAEVEENSWYRIGRGGVEKRKSFKPCDDWSPKWRTIKTERKAPERPSAAAWHEADPYDTIKDTPSFWSHDETYIMDPSTGLFERKRDLWPS